MKVEPVSIKTLSGPRRLEVETHAAAAQLPNAAPGDFASFDSIEISNPVPPPEQMIGSGATLTSNGSDVYVDPNAEFTPEGDMRSPSLASMLRAIKGYLADDLQQIREHHQEAVQQAQRAQAAQQAEQVQQRQAPQPAQQAQPAQPQAPVQVPGVKVVDPTKKSEPVEEGSHPAIPMPQGGFKPVEAQRAQPPPAPAPSPAPVKAEAQPPPPQPPPRQPEHQAA